MKLSCSWSRVLLPILAFAVSACTVGPGYQRPRVAMPAAWVAPRPHAGDGDQMIGWWGRFGDPVLTQLQALAEKNSPTLDQAVARIDLARANLASSRAQGLPSLSGSFSDTEAGQHVTGTAQAILLTQTGAQVSGDASWELDLFGKIRRGNQAAKARIVARFDDWHDARVSLAAEVADDYVQYRGCEQLADLYRQQSLSQGETARLTRISANAGFTAPADAELAEASAASVRSTYTDQAAQCDVLVKSLTSLAGQEEAPLRAILAGGKRALPMPAGFEVASVPADLLRQRPDVASSERELAATSAEIGVAVAALYPSLTLSGSISTGGGITQWSFGPSLSLPIFDGKARAGVRSARASYALQLATYRRTVRSAMLEVEQTLVRLESARARESDAERSAAGYEANFLAIDRLRQIGSTSMIERENAWRNALDARHSLVNLRIDQIRQWIALYKALGGGWGAVSSTIGEHDQ